MAYKPTFWHQSILVNIIVAACSAAQQHRKKSSDPVRRPRPARYQRYAALCIIVNTSEYQFNRHKYILTELSGVDKKSSAMYRYAYCSVYEHDGAHRRPASRAPPSAGRWSKIISPHKTYIIHRTASIYFLSTFQRKSPLQNSSPQLFIDVKKFRHEGNLCVVLIYIVGFNKRIYSTKLFKFHKCNEIFAGRKNAWLK